MTIADVSLIGADTADFAITSDTGEATLEPGETRTLTVVFSPATLGAKSAQLRIFSDDPDEAVVDVDMSGQGVIAMIFEDGFESGDTTAWSSSVP